MMKMTAKALSVHAARDTSFDSNTTLETPQQHIEEAKDGVNTSTKAHWFWVTATIMSTSNRRKPYYPACINNKCNKKVVPQDDKWHCPSCNVAFDYCQERFNISLMMSDFSGSFWVTFFDESARKIVGMSAKELSFLEKDNPDVFEDLFKERWSYSKISAKIRGSKMDNFSGQVREKSNRYVCIEIKQFDWVEESSHLLEKIRCLCY